MGPREDFSGPSATAADAGAGPIPRRRLVAAMVAIALAASIPYLGALRAPFVFDDVKLVKENRFLRSGEQGSPGILETFLITDRRWDEEELRPNYRPLRFLSYRLDMRLSELWFGQFPPNEPPVFFFHLTNVLLHLANALLVFALVRRLLAGLRGAEGWAFPGALWAALIFALHPLQTEAVTYVSGRRDVLSALFFLAGVAVHLRRLPSVKPAISSFVVLPLLLVAGFLSKEMVVTLPAVLVLLDLARSASWSARRIALHAVLGATAAAFVLLTLGNARLVQESPGRDILAVALTAARYVCRYLALAVFPYPQSVDYSFDAIPPSTSVISPWTTFPSLALVLSLLGASFLAFRRRRVVPLAAVLCAGCLWFLGSLVPVLQFVPIAEPFAERFAYLPMVGLALILGAAAGRLARFEPILGHGAAAVVCGIALVLTVARNRDWESPLRLWTSAVRAQPRAARAHLGRANALKELGRYREAVAEYEGAIAILEERPDVPLHHGFLLQARTFRGGLLGLLGKEDPSLLDMAAEEFRRVLGSVDTDGTAITSSPRHTVLHFDLAGILLEARRLPEARAEYQRVLEIGEPKTLVGAAHYYLGKISLLEGNADEAVASLRNAYEAIPASDPVRYRVAAELADLLVERKELDAAWKLLETALAAGAAGQERIHLLYRQSKVLDRRGDLDGVTDMLRRILADSPAYAPALLTLGGIELNLGRFDEAEARYRAVPPTDPGYGEAVRGLQNVRLRRQLASEGPPPGDPLGPEGRKVLQALVEKGTGHVDRGEWIAARQSYVTLLARSRETGEKPFELKALQELALVEEKFGRNVEAARYLEAAMQLDPEDAESCRRMGDLQLRRLDDRVRAFDAYSRYVSLLPEGALGDPKVYFNMGQIRSQDDPQAAIEYMTRARQAGGDAAVLDRSLGYLYARTGEWGKSLEAFTRYLEAPPAGDEVEREAASSFVQQRVLPRLEEK